MLIQLLFLLLLLSLIYFLSRKITTSIYTVIYGLTKNRGVAVWVLALMILPGTIVHEVSHFIMATMLRVPTGRMHIFPTVEKDTDEVRVGKLFIAKTDPFRYTLIGIAPMIIGLSLIYFIGSFFDIGHLNLFGNLDFGFWILLIVICYLLFAVSATMFSSKKDLESLIIVGPIVLLFVILLSAIGIRVSFAPQLLQQIETITTKLNYYLLFALVIDCIVYSIFTVMRRLMKR